MAAASGITATPEVEAQFADAINNTNTAWLKVKIATEQFEIAAKGTDAGSAEANWAAAAETIDGVEAAYFIMRSPEQPERWILVFFVPMRAKVREKMQVASSAAALKRAFGQAHFIGDYQASDKAEISLQAYLDSIRDMEKEEVLTWQEMTKDAADIESALMVNEGSGQKSLVDIPVKHTEEALDAIRGLAAGNLQTVLLRLNPETEMLEQRSASANQSLDDAGAQLEERVPCYLLFRWAHDHPKTGESRVLNFLVYYCPMRAPPRSKMFYSACKSMLVELCGRLDFPLTKSLEVSEPKEVCLELLQEEVYPPEVEQQQVTKPKIRGQSAPARRRIGKFNAEA